MLKRRERVGQPGPLGGPGHGQLAIGIGDAGEAGGREDERVGERLAEDGGRAVSTVARPRSTRGR